MQRRVCWRTAEFYLGGKTMAKRRFTPELKQHMLKLHNEDNMTFAEIGRHYGVSKQRIHQMIGKSSVYHFKPIPPTSCVFKGIRDWMNENYISKAELCRRLYTDRSPSNYCRMRVHLLGKNDMRKYDVDRYLKVTGLTYEVAFAIGE